MNATETFSSGLQELLGSVSRVAQELWRNGWAEANGGNLSIDVTGLAADDSPVKGDAVPLSVARPLLAGRWFLITGSGRRFRDLPGDPAANACVLRIGDDGAGWRLAWGGCGGAFKPTSELPTHLALHESLRQHRPDRRVVLHTHPTELIALSHLGAYSDEDMLNRTLLGTMPEVKVLAPRGVGLVPYHLPGSEAPGGCWNGAVTWPCGKCTAASPRAGISSRCSTSSTPSTRVPGSRCCALRRGRLPGV